VPKHRRGALTWVLVAGAISSALEALGAALVLLVLRMVNGGSGAFDVPVLGDLRARFPGESANELIIWTIVVVAGFFVVRAIVAMATIYAQNRVSHRIGESLSDRVVRVQLHRPYLEFVRRSSNQTIRDAIGAVDDVVAYVLTPLVAVFTEIVLVVAVIAVLAVQAPLQSVALAVLVVPPFAIVLRVVQPRVGRLGHVYQAAADRALAVAQHLADGMRDIRVLGREDFFARQFEVARAEQIRAQYLVRSFVDLPRLLLESVIILAVFGLLAFQLGKSDDPQASVETLGLFGYAAIRVLPSLNRLTANVNLLRFGGAAVDRVEAELAHSAPAPASDAPPQPLQLRHGIRFEGVGFRYEPAGPLVLRDVDLELLAGQTIGIVGRTASGKSTLVDLLLGLYAPTEGRITVDGVDLQTIVRRWQASVGLVSQHVFLFNDSIAGNIAVGVDADAVDVDRMHAAIAAAQLENEVSRMSAGVAAPVGEHGSRLSGGQRQRVAIARALYREPTVLVFDEGTSALDSATESSVIAALSAQRPERTQVFVAHRLATVRDADLILVIDQGRVSDVGTYDDLLARSPLFRELAAT